MSIQHVYMSIQHKYINVKGILFYFEIRQKYKLQEMEDFDIESSQSSVASSQASVASRQASVASSQTNSRANEKKDWVLVNKKFDDCEKFQNFINLKMPYNTIRSANNKTYCKLSKGIGKTKHKVTTEYRFCHPHKILDCKRGAKSKKHNPLAFE